MEENVSVPEQIAVESNGHSSDPTPKKKQATLGLKSQSSRLKKLKIDDARMSEAAQVTDKFRINGPESPTRGEVRAAREQLQYGDAERLQALLPEVLKDRPDLYEMLLWDAKHNPADLVDMMGRISGIKGKNGGPAPYDAVVTTLRAIGALNGHAIQHPDVGFQNFMAGKEVTPRLEGTAENPFRSEMLRPEKVWESVRIEKMKHIDETGKEVESQYMVVEFSMNSWARIDLPQDASDEQKQLRTAVEEYIKCRYKWETNVLKDKKFQIVRLLPSGINGKMKDVLEMLGSDKENIHRERGVTRDDFAARVEQKFGELRYPDMDAVSRALGIDSLLSRKKIIVDFDHGWCGDGAVDSSFISQAMFAANSAIMRDRGNKFRNNEEIDSEVEVIGITSDNMGIVRSSREKARRQRIRAGFLKGIKLVLGDKKNPNISDDEFFGIRHGQEMAANLVEETKDGPVVKGRKAADPLFTQKEYGRDIFWKKNMVFGILGETNGMENTVVNGGWSFGGGALMEYETTVLQHVENAWKEKVWTEKIGPEIYQHQQLKQQLEENLTKLLDINPGFVNSEEYLQYLAIAQAIPEAMNALLLEYANTELPNIDEVADVGMPNQFNIRFAPAVNNSCIFLGESRGIQQLWKRGLSKTSLGIVKLGTYLSNKGLTRLRLGESTLRFIAKLYTARILPVAKEHSIMEKLPLKKRFTPGEDKKEVKKAGLIHVLNYANRENAAAVFLQTDGLIRYSGLTQDQERLLRTGHSKNLTIVSRWDRLVGFNDLTRELCKREANELCITVNSGHYASASDTMRHDFPYELLFEASPQDRDDTIKDWATIAQTNYNLPVSKSMRDLGIEEYMERQQNLDDVLIHDSGDQITVNDALIRIGNRFKKKNPKLEGKVRDSTKKMAGLLYMPRYRDLKGMDMAA